jgi:hypothetical protein
MTQQILLLGGPEHGKLVPASSRFPLYVIDHSKIRTATLKENAKISYSERKIRFFGRDAMIAIPMNFSEAEMNSLGFHTFVNPYYTDFFSRRD